MHYTIRYIPYARHRQPRPARFAELRTKEQAPMQPAIQCPRRRQQAMSSEPGPPLPPVCCRRSPNGRPPPRRRGACGKPGGRPRRGCPCSMCTHTDMARTRQGPCTTGLRRCGSRGRRALVAPRPGSLAGGMLAPPPRGLKHGEATRSSGKSSYSVHARLPGLGVMQPRLSHAMVRQ